MTLGSDIYSGLGSIGRVESILGAVIAVAVSVVVIIMGIALIKTPYTSVTMATIQTAQCVASGTTHSSMCQLAVTYTVNGVIYDNHLQALSNDVSGYVKGAMVSIRYDPSNPENAMIGANEHTIGFIMIGLALLVIVASVANAYLTSSSKAYAAYSGATDILGRAGL